MSKLWLTQELSVYSGPNSDEDEEYLTRKQYFMAMKPMLSLKIFKKEGVGHVEETEYNNQITILMKKESLIKMEWDINLSDLCEFEGRIDARIILWWSSLSENIFCPGPRNIWIKCKNKYFESRHLLGNPWFGRRMERNIIIWGKSWFIKLPVPQYWYIDIDYIGDLQSPGNLAQAPGLFLAFPTSSPGDVMIDTVLVILW